MKETIYFRHDYDAHADPKMVKLRMKYGREGYGMFWAILEVMRSDADIVINLCDIDAIAYRLHCECDAMKSMMDYFAEIGLFIFDKKDQSYYSERLQSDVEYMREKSRKAKRSAEIKREKKKRDDANAMRTHSDGNAIKDNIRKEKKRKDNKKETVDDLDPLSQAIQNFKDMRVQIKSKMTDHAVDLLMDELEKLAPGDDAKKIAILNKSIVNSWKGVFPLKEGDYKSEADEDRNNYKKLLIENRLQETQGNHDETRQKKLRGVAQAMIAKYTEEKVREYRKQVLSSL